MSRQQLFGGGSLPKQHRMDERRQDVTLSAKWLAIPRHLKARPEPSSPFDNVARRDNPIQPKGADLRDYLRDVVMAAAIATGDDAKMLGTQAEISAYLDEIATQVFSRLPAHLRAPLEAAAVVAVREAAEATEAIAHAEIVRCPQLREVAVREAAQAIPALQLYVTSTGRSTLASTRAAR